MVHFVESDINKKFNNSVIKFIDVLYQIDNLKTDQAICCSPLLKNKLMKERKRKQSDIINFLKKSLCVHSIADVPEMGIAYDIFRWAHHENNSMITLIIDYYPESDGSKGNDSNYIGFRLFHDAEEFGNAELNFQFALSMDEIFEHDTSEYSKYKEYLILDSDYNESCLLNIINLFDKVISSYNKLKSKLSN